MLKVGPISAGAKPGPACYDLGGTEPTVTDANLILGRLSPRGLIAGALPLDVALARKAFEPVANRIGMSIEAAALGCIEIVVANMVRAIRGVSVERGHDPRNFALMPFGGGGPLHADEVARALGITSVIVPPNPGILCAEGIVVSDLKENFVRTRRFPLVAENAAQVRAVSAEILTEAQQWFVDEAVSPDSQNAEITLDVRYIGQNYELSVPLPVELLDQSDDHDLVARIRDDFHIQHDVSYGHCDRQAAVEIINVRCVARGRLSENAPPKPSQKRTETPTPREERLVWFDREAPISTPVFDRDDLDSGHTITGPAIIEQMDTTTLVRKGTTVNIDNSMCLNMENVS